MTLLLRGAIAAALLACAPAAYSIELSVSEPGFLSIDGLYYSFGLREPAVSAKFAKVAMLGSEGFYLQTLLEMGSCQRSEGAPATMAGTGTRRLRAADMPLADAGLIEGLALALDSGQSTNLRIASCKQIAVLHLQSADGNVRCEQHFRFPFERGECPQLDALDPTYITHSGFE